MTIRLTMIAATAFLVICGIAAAKPAGDRDELYRAEAIVTGTGETERLGGFRIGAEEVLIKLTGRPDVIQTGRAKSVLGLAPGLVAEHSYEDRMKDIPIHDEQGTRDRPHFLRMRFDREKFDAALKRAGIEKWTGERPTVAVWLGIREGRGKSYILSTDGENGYSQREALKDASKRRAIPILLPEEEQDVVSYKDLVRNNWSAIRQASRELGSNTVLYGTLEFDGEAHWNCAWVTAGERAYAKWTLKRVTFDEALKDAIDRVMSLNARQGQ